MPTYSRIKLYQKFTESITRYWIQTADSLQKALPDNWFIGVHKVYRLIFIRILTHLTDMTISQVINNRHINWPMQPMQNWYSHRPNMGNKQWYNRHKNKPHQLRVSNLCDTNKVCFCNAWTLLTYIDSWPHSWIITQYQIDRLQDSSKANIFVVSMKWEITSPGFILYGYVPSRGLEFCKRNITWDIRLSWNTDGYML